MGTWTDDPAADSSSPRPRPRYRDPRTGRHRLADEYPTPACPSLPCQRAAITSTLIAAGLADRAWRLAYCSDVTRRRIPSLIALSMSEATMILLAAGIDRGRSHPRRMPR